MLEIVNESAKIVSTNFWDSEYDRRGLVYLSVNAGALRLLLPKNKAGEWLKEIKTSKKCVIEKSANPGYVDLVFEDGTDAPFALSVHVEKQTDSDLALNRANLKMIVYAGSLNETCYLFVTDKADENERYINHITARDGCVTHARKSYKKEVSRETLDILAHWVEDLENDHAVEFIDGYFLTVERSYPAQKSAFFSIRRGSEDGEELVKFGFCAHARTKGNIWREFGEKADCPPLPFLAATVINENIRLGDYANLPVFADFERCLTWAYLEAIENGQ